MANELTLYKYK